MARRGAAFGWLIAKGYLYRLRYLPSHLGSALHSLGESGLHCSPTAMFWDDASKSALRAARDAVSILEAQKARALGAQGVPASPPSVRAPAAAALDAKGWHRDSGKRPP